MGDAPEVSRMAHPLFQAGGGGSTPTSALSLVVDVIGVDTARELNRRWHSRMPRFGSGAVKADDKRFLCFGAEFDGLIYAVAIWSAPPARMSNGKPWLELRRYAVAPDAPKNTASRVLRVMELLIRKSRPGIERLTTQHDTDVHTGGIYKAAGWEEVGKPRRNGTGGEWTTRTRHRPKVQSSAPKQRWEKVLHGGRDDPERPYV